MDVKRRPKRQHVSLRLPEDLLKAAKEDSKRMGVRLTDFIEAAIRAVFKNKGEKKDEN